MSRTELARCRRELHVVKAQLEVCRATSEDAGVPVPASVDELVEDEDPVAVEELQDDGQQAVETMAAAGNEVGLRAALSPSPRASCREAYRALLNRALVCAAEAGQVGTCKMLVRRGALDARRLPCRRSKTGWTALHAAAFARSAEVVEVLVSTEACAPQPPELGRTSTEDPLDLADASGKTAVMIAAERRAADAVRALLRAGADAGLRLADGDVGARELCAGDAKTLTALESSGERFWNASAAGNRAWRRKDFAAALAHFASALSLSAELLSEVAQASSGTNHDTANQQESPPSAVDLARLELNCAKAALRLGRGLEAAERAEAALERHRVATRGGVYANALAVRAECRESVYDFGGAASDFDELAQLADKTDPDGRRDDARGWRERARKARESRDATHYAVLGVDPRAEDHEIKRAYKRASMRWHPDRRSTSAASARDDRARAERHFRRINDAKETLLDSYKRAVYDVEHRRRLAAEAERAADTVWPWHARQQPRDDPPAAHPSATRRYTRPWTRPTVSVDAAPAFAPSAAPTAAPAASKHGEAPPAPAAAATLPDADDAPLPPAQGDASDDWSWRLRRYEDELRRQRDELERARQARANAVEERKRQEFIAERLEADVAAAKAARSTDDAAAKIRRFAKPTNGDEEKRFRGLFDDDDDLGSSLADALAAESFFAPRTADEDTVLDDVVNNDQVDEQQQNEDAAADEHELVAQLRDAAEWFDVLDTANKGVLDMSHFDELVDRLGLRDVLGEVEMQRQRFFADPVGSGVLRRGAFLGWFAVRIFLWNSLLFTRKCRPSSKVAKYHDPKNRTDQVMLPACTKVRLLTVVRIRATPSRPLRHSSRHLGPMFRPRDVDGKI